MVTTRGSKGSSLTRSPLLTRNLELATITGFICILATTFLGSHFRTSTIAAAVEEQGAATQEISRNVQQAADGSQQVSSHITDVQRGATETGSASSQLLSAAQSLSSESTRLKHEVFKFLQSVRAA